MINLSAFHLIAFGVFCTVIGLSTPGIVFSVCAIISGIVGLYAYIHEAEQARGGQAAGPFGLNGALSGANLNTVIGEPIGADPIGADPYPAFRQNSLAGEFETGTNEPKLDAKFYGSLFKVKNGQRVWDDEWCVFLAKDNAFAAALPVYREKCKEMGASADQLAAVDRLIERVEKWRAANPTKCKTPDVQAGEALLDVAPFGAPISGAIKDGAA